MPVCLSGPPEGHLLNTLHMHAMHGAQGAFKPNQGGHNVGPGFTGDRQGVVHKPLCGSMPICLSVYTALRPPLGVKRPISRLSFDPPVVVLTNCLER